MLSLEILAKKQLTQKLLSQRLLSKAFTLDLLGVLDEY